VECREEYLIKRRRKKISMQQIAKQIGCSQSLISRYETGDVKMSDSKLQRYREYIDQFNQK
jgi:transcriptional regulator with XRE-family HTH domain